MDGILYLHEWSFSMVKKHGKCSNLVPMGGTVSVGLVPGGEMPRMPGTQRRWVKYGEISLEGVL